MKKQEVELIIIGINMGKEEILNMKIYKDGTLCRKGCGGMPTFSISGMTVEGKKDYWTQLFPLIQDQLVENPINYEEKDIKNPLEYFMAFYGGSTNGQTGEQANWTKTSGIRFLLDNETSFRHPFLGFLDGFAIKAAEVTNDWFFDIVMTAVYDFKPVGLENTFVTVPKTDGEKQEALSRYVNQINANGASGWDITKIGNGRKYLTKEGRTVTASVKNNAGNVSINFSETFEVNDTEAIDARLKEMFGNNDKAPMSEAKPRVDKQAIKETKPTKKWWEFWK